jgi:2-polyprenyl-3-methyl-5-hydroxy-6-metoxy-1,4-benzoquinol methylase
MAGTFGRDTESVPYWEQEAARYHDHVGDTRAAYHGGRLATADRLLERAGLAAGARVVDFGCGDGVYSRRMAEAGFEVVGLDPAGAMIDLARERGGGATYEVGGAGALAAVGPFDALVALNVLAYMTDDEMATFWSALEQRLRPGGVLLVSHSNELFDLFALNAGTDRFFAEHLTAGRSVGELLADTAGGHAAYNVRANPLTYGDELATHGLTLEAQAFFNLHPLPPALLGEGDEDRILDPDEIARVPLWKQQLQCSTMFALARRGR